MVSTERPSALLKRWPNPFSAFPSGTENMLAGYSTVVPNSGITNVCQSSAGWWLRIWASAPETADNAASVPASRDLATAYMVRPPYDCAGRARRLRRQRLGSTYVSCGGADAAPGRRPARQTRLLQTGQACPQSLPMDLQRGGARSTSGAVGAARLLRAVHAPYPRWKDRDSCDHVCGPLVRRVIRAHAGVAGEHPALEQQRDAAGAEHGAACEQPFDRHAVRWQHARLRVQKRILECGRFGLRIVDLERVPDFVFAPHLVPERERECVVAQDDDGCRRDDVRGRRFACRQERMGECQRGALVDLVRVHQLTMASLQRP